MLSTQLRLSFIRYKCYSAIQIYEFYIYSLHIEHFIDMNSNGCEHGNILSHTAWSNVYACVRKTSQHVS